MCCGGGAAHEAQQPQRTKLALGVSGGQPKVKTLQVRQIFTSEPQPQGHSR